jgi:16S rRNA (adenine1518-N6/adenine1519-N6)-dimethyltransferase
VGAAIDESIGNLLRVHGVRLKKSLGQNFLGDPVWLNRIVAAAGVAATDTVLEIGAGAGSLTRPLAQAAQRVLAVEIDGRLLPVLHAVLAELANVHLHHGDILEQDLGQLLAAAGLAPRAPYKVVANIPYYITAPILRMLLEAPQPPALLVLTLQYEVAQRLAAGPGDMSLLALSVQVYGVPHIVGRIPAGAFFPKPEVDSAIVRVDLHAVPVVPAAELALFFRVARAGFGQRRKQLLNSLAAGLGLGREPVRAALDAAGLEPRRRAETLSVPEWRALARAFST